MVYPPVQGNPHVLHCYFKCCHRYKIAKRKNNTEIVYIALAAAAATATAVAVGKTKQNKITVVTSEWSVAWLSPRRGFAWCVYQRKHTRSQLVNLLYTADAVL